MMPALGIDHSTLEHVDTKEVSAHDRGVISGLKDVIETVAMRREEFRLLFLSD
jgi:hypothetical protein